ncbi:hypothetical protein AL01_01380 [Bombella intestini]|uniref:Uncharacterized protein n=1 Tax=Bombella intestini TaxID=1539051 RepID=A0A1S8GRE6_9PROT|nr:hypothetical protein AL01_01380 [Bombella intestini]
MTNTHLQAGRGDNGKFTRYTRKYGKGDAIMSSDDDDDALYEAAPIPLLPPHHFKKRHEVAETSSLY